MYFPQSDLSLKIPIVTQSGIGLISDLHLITLRTLRNDSMVPKDVNYEILPPKEKFVSLDTKTGNIILEALPKEGKREILL